MEKKSDSTVLLDNSHNNDIIKNTNFTTYNINKEIIETALKLSILMNVKKSNENSQCNKLISPLTSSLTSNENNDSETNKNTNIKNNNNYEQLFQHALKLIDSTHEEKFNLINNKLIITTPSFLSEKSSIEDIPKDIVNVQGNSYINNNNSNLKILNKKTCGKSII